MPTRKLLIYVLEYINNNICLRCHESIRFVCYGNYT